MPIKIVKTSKGHALRHQRRFSIVGAGEWLVGEAIWVPSPNDEVVFDKGDHQ